MVVATGSDPQYQQSATATTRKLYQAFTGEHDPGRGVFHGDSRGKTDRLPHNHKRWQRWCTSMTIHCNASKRVQPPIIASDDSDDVLTLTTYCSDSTRKRVRSRSLTITSGDIDDLLTSTTHQSDSSSKRVRSPTITSDGTEDVLVDHTS